MEQDLNKTETVNGFTFELEDEQDFYECRGEVCHDDEHDEIPEPSLWRAASLLVERLHGQGYTEAYKTHSEKGWVEVYIK